MDEPDISEALNDLTTTDYGEFLKLWPQIKEARERKVAIKVIYKKLDELNLVTVSYVTFTRFVKKVTEDEAREGVPSKATAKPVQARQESVRPTAEKPSEAETTEPSNTVEKNADKSGTVATEVAVALEKSIAASTKKDYAKRNFRGQ